MALRLRPTENDTKVCGWEIDGDSNSITATQGRIKTYSFDALFSETTPTREIYDRFCRSVVAATHVGRNGTIFAYGNTGSGKTFTMQGGLANGEAQLGIIHHAAHDIFARIENDTDSECTVRVKYFEIYNEQIRDLIGTVKLGKNGKQGELPVLSLSTHNGIKVNGTEVTVKNIADVQKILKRGHKNRTIATTDYNKQSSRSHAIFQMKIEIRKKTSAIMSRSVLNLVDLAGSEKNYGKKGSTRKIEGGKINQSLLSLSKVIHSLSIPEKRRPKHIGFRESKLTRILEPSLSGKACTAVLCCASREDRFLEETRSTLKFSESARLVTCKPQVNKAIDASALVLKLHKELEETRKALIQLQEHITHENTQESTTAEEQSVSESTTKSDDVETESSEVSKAPSDGTESTSDDNSPSSDIEDHSHLQGSLGAESLDVNSIEESHDQREVRELAESSESLDFEDSHAFLNIGETFRESILEGDEYDETSVSYYIEIVDQDESNEIPVGEVLVGAEKEAANVASLSKELAESNDHIQQLQVKLESANRLVDTLFSELKEARSFNEEALDRNELMQETIVSLKKVNRAISNENQALRGEQALLKYAIYAALFFCWTGYAEYFLCAVMFLWLSLETLGCA